VNFETAVQTTFGSRQTYHNDTTLDLGERVSRNVASNRRSMAGRKSTAPCFATRQTADPALVAEPEGTIDPMVPPC
jgi:hypothetical protein